MLEWLVPLQTNNNIMGVLVSIACITFLLSLDPPRHVNSKETRLMISSAISWDLKPESAMGFPNRVFWQITSSNLTLKLKDIIYQHPHQVYGTTNGTPFNSASSWMTLVSNMLGYNTSTISLIFSKNITEFNSTWRETSLQVSISNGIMLAGIAASSWKATSKPCSSSSNILAPPNCISLPTSVLLLPTASRHSSSRKRIHPRFLMTTASDAFKKS
jgi:hypothetical protein